MTRGAVLVVAPHPDDDVLGCGAFLAAAAARGRRIVVAYVTDGAASHVGSAAFPPERLRAVREEEARCGLRRLGIATEPHFLRRADGGLSSEGAAADALVAELRALVPNERDVLILGPWRRDPHPDHRAAASIVRRAVLGMPVRYAEYCVWLAERGEASDRPRKGDGRTVRLATHAYTDAKRAAIAEHRSQLGAVVDDAATGFVLPKSLVARALDGSETFVVPAR